VTATAAELNKIDGGTSATGTTVADADRVVFNDNGTMVQVAVTDLSAYFDDEITTMPNLVSTAATTVGALNSGSITSGFGTINNGSSAITTSGTVTYGTLNDGTTNLATTVAELNIIDGGTSATGTTVADADRVVLNDNGTMVQVAMTDINTYVTATAPSGGTITQGTSKSTGVTLNKYVGQITMHNASLADAAAVTFTLTNSLISANDVVVACHGAVGTAGAYVVQANTMGSGTCKITVRNLSGGDLSEAIVVNFSVIKGASS
jgi:hypothetical protein